MSSAAFFRWQAMCNFAHKLYGLNSSANADDFAQNNAGRMDVSGRVCLRITDSFPVTTCHTNDDASSQVDLPVHLHNLVHIQ